MVLVMLHASICWSEGWAGTSFEPGVAHVARFGKGDVHLQGVPERHRSVAGLAFRQFQVVPQQLLVVRMRAVLDDGYSPLSRRFPA